MRIDLRTKKTAKFDWPVIGGPADFYYDKQLYIPEMVGGKIIIRKI
jgi:hypothetical protein